MIPGRIIFVSRGITVFDNAWSKRALINFRLFWPCIMNVGWRERNQQDATNLMFIIKRLSQHVSGIIMPIIRRTRVCTAAYGVLHWSWWLWLCVAGTRAVLNSNFHSAQYVTQLTVTASEQDQDGTGSVLNLFASCQQTCMTRTFAVCTVKNSWWRIEELSETCRVLFQK